MGRYYYGDISGKFWVAIQESYDPCYFEGKLKTIYSFLGCGCEYEMMGEIDEKIYCKDCFSSYEEHVNDCELDRIQYLYQKDTQRVRFEFTKSHLPIVKQNIKELEKEYGHFIKTFSIDEEQGFEYHVEYEENLSKEIQEKIARLCLGRQILACIEKKGSCQFVGEC